MDDDDYFNPPDPDHNQMDLLTLMMQIENLSPQPYFHFPIFNPNSASSSSSSPSSSSSTFAVAAASSPAFPAAMHPSMPADSGGELTAVREMIFRMAAMQPVHIDPESVKPPKRRNVRISTDPLSVAARHRRERISERMRILQRLVPGGTKMDTASMLDEAIHYMKFLKSQVQSLERAAATANSQSMGGAAGFAPTVAMEISGRNLNYYPALSMQDQEHHQDFNMN